MDRESIVRILYDLIQLDMDAIEACEQALKNIHKNVIYNAIKNFQIDHIRHVDDISKKIISLGESSPGRSKDLKGFIIKGFTAIRSTMGIEGALQAMKLNEELINKKYTETLKIDLPLDIKALIKKNLIDEERHLQYIKYKLKFKY